MRGWPHCTGLQQVEWLDFIGPHDCSKTACRPTLLRLPLGSSGLCALLVDANTPYFRASTSTSMCDTATAASVCGISVRLHYHSLPLFGNRLDATFINLPGRSSLTVGIQHVSATMACPDSSSNYGCAHAQPDAAVPLCIAWILQRPFLSQQASKQALCVRSGGSFFTASCASSAPSGRGGLQSGSCTMF